MSSRRVVLGILLALVVTLGLTACPPPPPAGVAYVAEGPPPLRSEIIITTPGPDYVWVPGYWNWGGSSYVWMAGAWRMPPHAGAVWVAPRWYHSHHGWYSVQGGWR